MKHGIGLSALALCLLLAGTFGSQLPASTGDSPSVAGDAGASPNRIVAYYFHGNARCRTCRTIEAYTAEAITGGFAAELAAGRLEWRVVNTDLDENRHFVKDFELVTKSVVLAEYRGDEVTRFTTLNLVWQLVGNKDGFLTYVRDAVRDFLGEP